jgi:hypothetical protein
LYKISKKFRGVPKMSKKSNYTLTEGFQTHSGRCAGVKLVAYYKKMFCKKIAVQQMLKMFQQRPKTTNTFLVRFHKVLIYVLIAKNS